MYNRKKQVNSAFSKYYTKNIFKIIKYFFRDLKFCCQRIKYGWCEKDCWSIDTWFLGIMPDMIRHLRDNKCGHPADLTEEEWDNILNTLIVLFNEADKENCQRMKNEYKDVLSKKDPEIYHKYDEREKEIFQYRNECKDKGFKTFSKYFWNLWD